MLVMRVESRTKANVTISVTQQDKVSRWPDQTEATPTHQARVRVPVDGMGDPSWHKARFLINTLHDNKKLVEFIEHAWTLNLI